ncbi:serine hydrolase domain-containing protein [Shewanella sp. 125m-7]
MKRFLCVLFGLLWSSWLFAEQPLASTDEAKLSSTMTLEALKAAIVDIVETENLPAVAIAMVNQEGPVWIEAIGLANIANNQPADSQTLFRIGSTSKMFVSLSILKLVEQGKLSLDDKLADLAPEIAYTNQWEASDPIRIVHLLEHTTGWDDIHIVEYAHNDPSPATLKQGLDYHPHSRVSRWKPGSRMAYCNAGPPVAAYIVEKVTGQVFEDYVADNFFIPMGMETMSYFQSDDVKAKGATLYSKGKEEAYWHIIMRPSGSINASANDMAKFLSFLVNRGRAVELPLISEASFARMEQVKSTPAAQAGQTAGYGLSNYSTPYKQWIYQGHDGGVSGGITKLEYLPEAGVGHVVMINSDDAQSVKKITELIREFETKELTEKSITATQAVTDSMKALQGYYYPINSRMAMTEFLERVLNIYQFTFKGGKLIRTNLLGGVPKEYFPVSETLFQSAETGEMNLSFVEDPLVGPVFHSDSSVYRSVSAVIVFGQFTILALWLIINVTGLLYLLVWGVRIIMGADIKGNALMIRVWPLLATLSVLCFVLMFQLGGVDPFRLLGNITYVSIGLMLSSIALLIFTFLGCYVAIKAKASEMNKVNYWYCTIASCTHLLVVSYLAWFGIIGLQTWA